MRLHEIEVKFQLNLFKTYYSFQHTE